LLREVTIMSVISHPNVATCIAADISIKKDNSYVIFPYYEKTLEQVIQKETSILDMLTKCLIAKDIVSGMCYLSSCGILHRCLSPRSIYIDKYYRAIIGDYELARTVNTDKRMSLGLGVPLYTAPELFIAETKLYGHEVDVYSFGILFWELLTTQTPYGDMQIKSVSDFISKVVNGMRPPLDDNIILHDLINLLTRCWSPNPANRPRFDEILYIIEQVDLT